MSAAAHVVHRRVDMRSALPLALLLVACACAIEDTSSGGSEIKVDAGAVRDTGMRDGASDAAVAPDVAPRASIRLSQVAAASAPVIVSTSTSRLVVAWKSGPDIVYRTSENAGNSWSQETNVSFAGEVTAPSLSVNSAGGAALAVAAGSKLMTMQLDATAAAFGAPTLVAEAPGATHVRSFASTSGTRFVTYDVAGRAGGYRLPATAAPSAMTITLASAEDVSLCEGSGRLYAIYREANGTSAHASVRTSDDDGKTWSTASVHAEKPGATQVSTVACVAHGDDIWAVWATPAQTGMLSNVEVAHSTNRGQSFRPETLTAFDTTASTVTRRPAFVREEDGTLGLAYIGGTSANDPNGALRYARKGVRIFDPSEIVDSPVALGAGLDESVVGAATRGTTLFVAYASALSSGSAIYFRTCPLSPSAH